MNIPEVIRSLIKDISAPQAYEILRLIGNPSVTVFSNGLVYSVKNVVAEESVRGQKAASVGPFTFWGGPPTSLRYYDGTLYTLLCDRLLSLIQAHGVNAAREICCLPKPEKVKVWL